jgi:hypothetical protein
MPAIVAPIVPPPFKEWLNATVSQLKDEADKRKDALNNARAEFATVRAKVILPVLKRCEADLKAADIFAKTKNENGDSASLSADNAVLTFRLVELRIVCAGTSIDEEEFDLSVLDEARVDEKVRQFVEPVLRARFKMGDSASGIMIPQADGTYRTPGRR